MERVHPRTMIVEFFDRLFVVGVSILVMFVFIYMFRDFGQVVKLIVILGACPVIFHFWLIILIPLEYRRFSYRIDNKIIEIMHGGLDRHHYFIPVRTIQHVDVKQRIFSRIFRLYAVQLYTAADTHVISYVTKSKAYQLKDQITDLIDQVNGEK